MTEGWGGGYPTAPHECGYPTETPRIRTSGYADILAKRDMLLRELEALRNKVAGLSFAIDVVAEELAASADTRPEGGDSTKIEAPFTGGAVPKADAQTTSKERGRQRFER